MKPDKKELKKHYLQTPPAMGVFQVKNITDGKILVVSARNLPGIMNSYRFQLNQGSCHIQELQSDYTRLGAQNFLFEVLDTLKPAEDPNADPAGDLRTLEEMWIERLQPFGSRGYHQRKPGK